MEELLSALKYDFFRNAVIAGVLVSLAAGILGVYVILNRITILSGGIAHAAYGGVGIAFYFGLPPLIGGVIFSLFASLLMTLVQHKAKQRTDMLIGVMWAVGMAIGIIFIDKTPGYKADLMSYLFGSLIAISQWEIWVILALDVVILFTVIALYRSILSISYDQVFSSVRGVPVNGITLLMIMLTAASTVMMMRVIGLILVIALLTIPSAIANLCTHDMRKMMFIASLFGIIFTIIGLWFSYKYNLTSGAMIILVSASVYALALLIKRLRIFLNNHVKRVNM
jgi:zinc transport system permease protein